MNSGCACRRGKTRAMGKTMMTTPSHSHSNAPRSVVGGNPCKTNWSWHPEPFWNSPIVCKIWAWIPRTYRSSCLTRSKNIGFCIVRESNRSTMGELCDDRLSVAQVFSWDWKMDELPADLEGFNGSSANCSPNVPQMMSLRLLSQRHLCGSCSKL